MDKRAALVREFRNHFPERGDPGLCRAPGRINLIGEHTDYNGLPVLPMTLDREIRIAFAPRDDGLVRMHSVLPAYRPAEFRNGPDIPPSPTGAWENYGKAAVQCLNRRFQPRQFPGLDMLVDGDIPSAAGLSSSSALVVACALAYLRALGKRLGPDISRLELAARLAEGEHYVGTQGGGMDQAIILLGGEGVACKIDFFPLRVEPVPLPDDHVFVGCHSLVQARKTGEALHRYNAGPVLCRLIRALVERQAQRDFGEEVTIDRLGDLWQGHLCLTDAEVESLFERTFATETLTLEEAARALDLEPSEIRRRWLGDLREPEGGFRLRARARHLLTENRRVEHARDALLARDPESFGALMDESHRSCADDYEISCPELDTLVEVTRRAGARGARLTGAGFGGYTVNLVPRARYEEFARRVEEEYYCLQRSEPPSDNGRLHIFAARAGAAAGYME